MTGGSSPSQGTNLEYAMSKNFTEEIKEALAKKQGIYQPDAKLSKTQQKAVKRKAPPSPGGKPMRKVTGRGG